MALASFAPLSIGISPSIARHLGGDSSSGTKQFHAPVCPTFHRHTSARCPPRGLGTFQSTSGNVLRRRVFLLFSAAEHFRRNHGSHLCRSRHFMASATYKEVKPKGKRIDTHLHVWASPEEAKTFPFYPGQEPTLPGSAAYLLQSMSQAGVDGALLIQPINHKFDHTYVSRDENEELSGITDIQGLHTNGNFESVLQKYPGKFVGCCLADPTEGGGGVRELERLINKEGYRAVRLNPYLWPSGEKVSLFKSCVTCWLGVEATHVAEDVLHDGTRNVTNGMMKQMTNEVGKALFSKAGELGAVVGFMCFKGLLLHIDDIEELCLEYPSTTVMIDHFGFCKPAKNSEEAEAWKRLLGLAQFPQVYVKVSAQFRLSREPFPYKDTWPLVQELLNVFGARRLLWGSDFPFIAAECGYTKATKDLPHLIAEALSISEGELYELLGGTAIQLFEGAWQESLLVV